MRPKHLSIFFSIIILMLACKKEPSQLILSPIFSDSMVLQQQCNAAIWGYALPGTEIRIEGSWGALAEGTVNNDSSWLVKIETPKAGGPYEISIRNEDSTVVLKNVLIGEVWLCSGQSNMEMPLKGFLPNDTINYSKQEIAAANYPDIRMFTVERKYSTKPVKTLKGNWKECNPENAGEFSATAYFFAKNLHEELNIPIGLIHSSWGGTPVEAWINKENISKDEDFTSIEKTLSTLETETENFQNWIKKHEVLKIDGKNITLENATFSDSIISKPDFDDSNWMEMNLPDEVENTSLGTVDGVFWFRKEIEIPAEWEGKELKLNLGPIDDRDWTYFNGELIGSTPLAGFWNTPRHYTIPAHLVKKGKAVIASRVLDTGGDAGFRGKGNKICLEYENKSISLENIWKFTLVSEQYDGDYYLFDINKNELQGRPKLSYSEGQKTPAMLYNGMIFPLLPYTLKGTIWYQGESNVGKANQYSRIFPVLIENWRKDFNNPEMPFYYVQIAPYNYFEKDPTSLAQLRDAQRRALVIKNTGMAVTLDIGNEVNIHPGNKQEVGRRLALWALAKTYGKEITCSGPIYSKMETDGNKLRLFFENTDDGMILKSDEKTFFEIAGEDGVYYKTNAVIEGDNLLISSPKVTNPINARYAFQEQSKAILFNGKGLPASSFTTEKTLKN